MKKVDENLVVIDETARNKRVWKLIDWHRVTIKAKKLVEPYLCGPDILLYALLFSEDSHSELTIVHEASGK